jgi:uroporphyrin-III C-methyltransferase/precorrin-2 dehydrogenase/sirohydrochlorin ferrochelatase
MKTFPMFLQMAGRHVVIAGGGEQAAQKTRLMLKTEARIEVVAPDLEPELAELAASGRIVQRTGAITPESFAGSALCFIATGCPGMDAALHDLAKRGGATVNVVDQPDLCDAITPSIVDRDPVVVAIGTEGTAPVLARQIKTKVEEVLEPRLGDLAALAGRLRGAAAARLGPRARRDLWRWVFTGAPREAFGRGAEREAARMIKEAIETGNIRASTGGSVALVGAGPGSKDLITLRGVQRLQEADVIFYDRLVDPEVLDLARRDAERVYVGKQPGCHAWPQDRITQTLVAAARQGKRVVRLKAGDPGIFGRASEEIAAVEAAGLPLEIVPGVTAASGAAASGKTVLTARDEIDTLIFATGHLADGAAAPDWLDTLRPGTCVALYMSVRAAAQIEAALAGLAWRDQIDVSVVVDAQKASERRFACSATTLAQSLAQHRVDSGAVIFLRLPKSAAQSVVVPLQAAE